MAKARSKVADYAVYLLIRIVVCVIQALPFSAAEALAAGLARLAYRLDRRHRRVAVENLRHAFPDLGSDATYDTLVRQVYRHFCTLVMEIAHLHRRMHWNNWRQYLELVGGPRTVGCLLSGRPLLIVTGHLGNWEMAGYTLGLLGFKTYAVARPLDNPYLDDFLRRFREGTGQKLLAKKGDFDQMEALLARGGVIATLGDQDAGQRGLFVDFFGRPASTHKAIALLALEHRVPLIVVGTTRPGRGQKYQVILGDLFFPEDYEGQPDAVKAMTQRFTTSLEALIRTAPEQYFWLHRRWKHQPAVKRAKRAA